MQKAMKLSKEQVKHVADLAALPLTEKEIEKFQKQLSSILNYISKLEKVNTKNVEPTAQTTGLNNITSKDVVDEERELEQEKALQNAKKTDSGYIETERVL